MTHVRLLRVAMCSSLVVAGACKADSDGPDDGDLASAGADEVDQPLGSSSGNAEFGSGGHGADAHGWPLGGFDIAATASNPFEHHLARSNIDRLAVEWVFDTA